VNRRQFLVAAAGAPALLRRDPSAFAARLGGVPLALVTADRDAHVVAVELGSGRVYRRIPTLPGPRSIETVGWTEAALIAHTTEGAVSILDARTLTVRAVLRGFGEPRYTATRVGGRWAYVSDSGRHEIAVVDIDAGHIAERVRVPGPARHVSLSPSGTTLWVALGSKAELVAVLDTSNPRRPRLTRTFAPPFRAHDVGFQPSSGRAWVTSGDEDAVAVYDTSNGALVRRVAADAPPQHLTFARGAAFITSGEDGRLRVRSLSTGALARTTRIPTGSYNVDEGRDVVFTPSLERGTLCILDRRGRLERSVRVAESSHDACFVAAV
jgi:DNA-binding beta-propeller fold protein YncE